MEARVFLYPGCDAGMFMGGVVVDDEMEIKSRRGLTIYLTQEFEELLVAMATEAFADDSSLKHVECREKCRRAVANVVMGHSSATPAF